MPPAPAPPLDSVIDSDFLAIVAEFCGKHFQSLWRGGRDGFSASQFHGRCDGHANAKTVILDTDGNIFGGFTPVAWELLNGMCKADNSQKSFVFTLTNPHNVAAPRFALRAERKHTAMICNSGWGSCFDGDCAIGLSDHCNANTDSYTFGFSCCYINDTGLDGQTFFTGSRKLRIKEVEAFTITDSTALPRKSCFATNFSVFPLEARGANNHEVRGHQKWERGGCGKRG
jgi:hypothetical protein